jgi:HAD superfamily hydrolase (TIGR01509 family)
MTLRALLLDVDGTVADTETFGHRPAYNRAFRKLGLQFRWGPKLYRRLLRQPGGRERLLHYIERYHPELGEHAAKVNEDPLQWVDQVHELKSRYFRSYVRRGKIPLRPGVARLIRAANLFGIKVALVSNASPASIKAMVRYGLEPGLAERIDVIVGGGDVLRKKPAPDSYQRAMQLLGVEPWECVAVEDSAVGLRAATAAGVRTLITVNPNTAADDFTGAALVLDNLGEPDAPATVIKGRLLRGYVGITDIETLLDARSKAA